MKENIKIIGISLVIGTLLGVVGTSFYDRKAIFSLEMCHQEIKSLKFRTEFIEYGNGSEDFGSDVYLDGYRLLYSTSWD